MDAGVSKLRQYGFRKVGGWILAKNRKGRKVIKAELDAREALADERTIYAYVADRKVKYIGICSSSSTTLKDRLNRHVWKNNKKLTSVRGIYGVLKKRGQVAIYAWKPHERRTYRYLPIDLVKGLENPLIRRFKTSKKNGGWNKQT